MESNVSGKFLWMQSLLEGTALQKKDAGQITGTNADLRKLSMKESMRILRGYGVTESEIKGYQLSCANLYRSRLQVTLCASHGSSLLKHQLSTPASSCAGLSRWQRISLVRDLANAKLQDGDSTVRARYARERKHSALELLEKSRHKARDIFERQVGSSVHPHTVPGSPTFWLRPGGPDLTNYT